MSENIMDTVEGMLVDEVEPGICVILGPEREDGVSLMFAGPIWKAPSKLPDGATLLLNSVDFKKMQDLQKARTQ